MPYQNNGSYLNPYDCHSPYQPGQSLPQYDEKKMMNINCLQRFSGIYCNNLPIGSCSNTQLPNRLHCQYHSCMAILTDGTPCPNPSAPGTSYCATGYHEENGRLPILHSPRSSFSCSQSTSTSSSDDHSSSMTRSYETLWSNGSHTGSEHAGSTEGYPTTPQHHAYHNEPDQQQPQHYQSHTAQLFPRSGIQWNTHYSHSQPASQYYSPHEQQGTAYYATTEGTDSEWGTIDKRSM